MYDYDAPDYGPGENVEVWDGDDMIHEVERVWGWSDCWEIARVDGIAWKDVPADTRTVVTDYIASLELAWEKRTRGRFC
jgi:hypothetical protein